MNKFACLAASVLSSVAVQSSFAHTVLYFANLDGPSEAPANASPGVGTALITFDYDLVTMRVEAQFSGLVGTTTNSHIHAATTVAGTGTAGVATRTPTFLGFPSGVTSGTYDLTYDMTLASSYNPAYITANGGTVGSALAAFSSALDSGKAYYNIHSSVFPGGEIRGFLAVIPEPTTSLAALAFGGLLLRRTRKQ